MAEKNADKIAPSDEVKTEEKVSSGVWLRFNTNDPMAVTQIEHITGVRLDAFRLDNATDLTGASPIYKIRFAYPEGKLRMESQVLFIINKDYLISLKPYPVPYPLNQAARSLKRDGRDNGIYDAFAVILQTLSDAADDLLDNMNEEVSQGLAQSTSVLETLDAKGKDFGVTDVVQTQVLLGGIEDTLSRCAENLLVLGLTARRAGSNVGKSDTLLQNQYSTLMSDIKAVEGDVQFLHERVRFLQLVNELALSTKQNQIIKVFTVMAAVFLPALLVSTYYSMNLEVLPLLDWPYAEPVTLCFTLCLALLPIIYVKQRGWLR
ncbi:MAG: CorA family divalent cation transporter [Burkholderiales bacterium]|nr:CorA family divalent cation transporter [Burkholderiales bacterium]